MVNDLCRNTNTTDIMQVIHQLRVATNVYRFKRYKPRLKTLRGTMKGRMGGTPYTEGNAFIVSPRITFLPEVGSLPH